MKKHITGLYNLARKHCIDILEMYDEYFEHVENGTEEQLEHKESFRNYSAKFHLYRSVLEVIEAFVPDDFASLEEARAIIVDAIKSASSSDIEKPYKDIYIDVFRNERMQFCDYIDSLSIADLFSAPDVFYRRTIGHEELQRIGKILAEIWDIGFIDTSLINKETHGYASFYYYYPLKKTNRADLIAFTAVGGETTSYTNGIEDVSERHQFNGFADYIKPEELQNILRQHGVKRVFELRESGTGCEMDVSIFIPEYLNGSEGFWFSEKMDWLIYASHENTITFGGASLIDAIKSIWPQWEECQI